MKKILYLFAILLLVPTVLAINLDVNKITSNEAMVLGLEDPAIFKINVTNNGATDFFSFYTFFGLGLEPREAIKIESGKTKELTLEVYPRQDLTAKGFTTFTYFIQDSKDEEVEKKLTLNIVNLEDAFEIGSAAISPESNSLEIYIHNKINFEFEDLNVKFSSAFFELEEDISLGPNERQNFKIDLNKEDFNELMAGFYTLSAKVSTEEILADVEGRIQFTEESLLETTTKNYGLIIFTKVIQTSNNGNVVGETDITLKRNAISRLFTSMKPEPTSVNREGLSIYYTWNEKLNPGEISEIVFKTNWLLPFIIIFLVVLIIVFTKKYSKTALVLKKKVSFVNAKGGEFALKVTVLVEAREYLEKVRIIDRLPPLVKVYGRFGGEIPARYHKTNKVFEWDFAELEAGEKRVLSYIIYSQVGVLGKFALPASRGVFQREGIMKEVSSNKAYFLAQQKGKVDFE